MHQTFYVDIDEEITSVVEKLRTSRQKEIVLVVPKRALLIQSIVNLKILSKEAVEMGLKISIMTQDRLGKLLLKKAGIAIQQKIEEEQEDRGMVEAENSHLETENRDSFRYAEKNPTAQTGRRRLDQIGTSEYFSEEGADVSSDLEKEWPKNSPVEPGQNPFQGISSERPEASRPLSYVAPEQEDGVSPKKEFRRTVPVRGVSGSMDVSGARKRPEPRPMVTAKVRPELSPQARPLSESVPVDPRLRRQPVEDRREKYTAGQEEEKRREEKLENFFYSNNFSGADEDDEEEKGGEKKGRGSLAKISWVFLAVVVFAGLSFAAYRFIPEATVTLFVKKEVRTADTEVLADVNLESLDYEKSAFPAKLLEFEEEFAKSFSSSGTKNVSNRKAKGKISIYNEFSSAPQTLVATTRFLSEDEKLFRLVQTVVVPGTTKVGDEIKPGVVEAEVVADEAGEQYNIGPAKFSIPGFKNSGNEKYAKIYGRSSAAMTGGGDGNEDVKVISEKDINDAKDGFSLEINNLMKAKIKDSIESGMVVLDDAISVDEPVFLVSNAVGDVADNFEIKIKAKGRALVFGESDVKKIANYVISRSNNGKTNIDSGAVLIDYGKPFCDFRLGTVSLKIHASSVIQPEINLDNLKYEILGKNSEELEEHLRTYPIEKAVVEYTPESFVTRVPKNANRVNVVIDSTLP